MKNILINYKRTYSGSSFYWMRPELRDDLARYGFTQSGFDGKWEVWKNASGVEVAIDAKHDYFTVIS